MAQSSALPAPDNSPDPDDPHDPAAAPLARPAAVLQWLQQGHACFLEGHFLHPHSTRERMRAVLGHEACGAVSAALHPELLLTPSLSQVVGQLRMELLQYGDHLSLEESCRRHTLSAAGNLVHSSVLLTDRVRAGQLAVVAGYYDLHSSAIDWMGHVEAIRYPGPAER